MTSKRTDTVASTSPNQARQRVALVVLSLILVIMIVAIVYRLRSSGSRINQSTSLAKLQEMAGSGSDNPDVYYYLGLNLKQKGDTASAKDAFAHAASLTDRDEIYVAWASCATDNEALTILTSFLAGHPQSFAGHLALAQLFAQWNDQAHCNEEVFKAVRIRQDSHDAWQLYGDSSLALSNFQAAADAFTAAIKLKPHVVHDSAGLAAALGEMNQPQKAIQTLQEATVFAPEDGTAWIGLGKMELENAKTEDALAICQEHLARGVKLSPQLAPGRLILAQCLIQRKRWKEAVSQLTIAKQGLPDEPSLYFLLAQAYRALSLHDHEKVALARHDKLAQFETDRTSLQLRAGTTSSNDLQLGIARLAVKDGAYNTAVAIYRAVITEHPNDAHVGSELADAERRLIQNPQSDH